MKKTRCSWCEKDDLYRNYHDNEWGTPLYDDSKLFEILILETFQAGLSWHTILKKRENFRTAFEFFDVNKVALFSTNNIQKLMQNDGIIKNKLKIEAAVTNAQAYIQVQLEYGSFSNYIWKFTNNTPIDNNPKSLANIQPTTPLSQTISKELKKRGFKFVGPAVTYAFMQAIGMVNDHLENCWKRQENI